MRKIDWDKALSDEDIAWLRQAGFMSEERIANHQAQFDTEVPGDETPEDPATKGALDASARVAQPVEGMGDGSPVRVVPEGEGPDDEADDYETWKVADLDEEVEARNKISEDREDVSVVTVTGTGKDGAVRKVDLIEGLRAWDKKNPNVL